MGRGQSREQPEEAGIPFGYATQVFDDPFILAELERIEDREERWQSIGLVEGIAVVFVAHTVREEGWDELIRIISARRATRKEQRRYGQNRQKNSRRVQTDGR